jgi:hypothetical protein
MTSVISQQPQAVSRAFPLQFSDDQSIAKILMPATE